MEPLSQHSLSWASSRGKGHASEKGWWWWCLPSKPFRLPAGSSRESDGRERESNLERLGVSSNRLRLAPQESVHHCHLGPYEITWKRAAWGCTKYCLISTGHHCHSMQERRNRHVRRRALGRGCSMRTDSQLWPGDFPATCWGPLGLRWPL